MALPVAHQEHRNGTAMRIGLVLITVALILVLSACKSSGPPEGSMVFDTAPSMEHTRVRFETSATTRNHARQSGLPVLLSGEASKYPSDVSKKETGNGWVQLVVEIDASGNVTEATVASSSNTVFHNAAIAAVHTWTFEAANHPASISQRLFFNAGTPAPDSVPTDIQ